MPDHKKRYMAQVVRGTLDHTPGGLTKTDIKVVRKGDNVRYVSKKRSENAKQNLGGWNQAVKEAKRNLGIDVNEFVLIKKGTPLYEEAARIYYG